MFNFCSLNITENLLLHINTLSFVNSKSYSASLNGDMSETKMLVFCARTGTPSCRFCRSHISKSGWSDCSVNCMSYKYVQTNYQYYYIIISLIKWLFCSIFAAIRFESIDIINGRLEAQEEWFRQHRVATSMDGASKDAKSGCVALAGICFRCLRGTHATQRSVQVCYIASM